MINTRVATKHIACAQIRKAPHMHQFHHKNIPNFMHTQVEVMSYIVIKKQIIENFHGRSSEEVLVGHDKKLVKEGMLKGMVGEFVERKDTKIS